MPRAAILRRGRYTLVATRYRPLTATYKKHSIIEWTILLGGQPVGTVTRLARQRYVASWVGGVGDAVSSNSRDNAFKALIADLESR